MPNVKYESESPLDIEEEPEALPVDLELAAAGEAHTIEGPYGALVATMASPSMIPEARSPIPTQRENALLPPARAQVRTPTRYESAAEVLRFLPVGAWKRIAFYSAFIGVLGNLVRHGGLSLMTNMSLGALFVLGVLGLFASGQQKL